MLYYSVLTVPLQQPAIRFRYFPFFAGDKRRCVQAPQNPGGAEPVPQQHHPHREGHLQGQRQAPDTQPRRKPGGAMAVM